MSRRERLVYAALLALSLGSTAAFLGWWLRPGHLPHNGHGRALDALLFAALTVVFGHRLFMDVFSWSASWGIRREVPPGSPQRGLRVAFITAFVPGSEPLELLYKALPAMRDAEYPHDTWVLDEGADDDVRALCESLGVRYFSRHGVRKYNLVAGPFTARTKGGNHNAWYAEHGDSYDVVAQLDSDFVPRSDFLTRTLGYFRDPSVGFVGTPQVYGNEGQSLIARGAAQQLFSFYGSIMRGLAGRGSANMIGANHVVRVAALRSVGFYAGHLTEDLLTGMRLHAAGWRSRYVAQPLAVGEGPATWQAYFNQQMRWAFGCMDILRRHSLGLTWKMGHRQRALYLALQQHYFSGVASALGLVLLAGYFFGGMSPADVDIRSMLEWSAPVLLMRQVTTLWLQRFNPSQSDRGLLLAGRYTSVVVWPIYLLAAVGVARQRRLVFKVTPKGSRQDARTPLSVLLPHTLAAAVTGACLVVGLLEHRDSVPMLFWAAVNTALMASFVVMVAAERWVRPRPAMVAVEATSAQFA